jgi:hypothetical protein
MHRYNSDEYATIAQMSAVVGERDFHLHHLAAEDAWLWLCKNNFIDIGSLTLQELTKTLPYGQRQTRMTALLADLKKLCF